MKILQFLAGLVLVLLGYWHIALPSRISRINSWLKENIFNDRLLILYPRKTGALCLLAGAILIYMAVKK